MTNVHHIIHLQLSTSNMKWIPLFLFSVMSTKKTCQAKKKKGIHIKEIKTDVTWSVVEINETPVVSIVCWCKAHKASVAGQKATELPEA